MSGPPNDAKPNQLVIGRVRQLSDGTKVVTPLPHREVVLGHQARVRELIEAAEAFKSNPTEVTHRALIKAALAI